MARHLGHLKWKKFSGHSICRSGATWIAETGCTALTLKKYGTWKSLSSAQRYIDDSQYSRRAIATLLETQLNEVGTPPETPDPPRTFDDDKPFEDHTPLDPIRVEYRTSDPRRRGMDRFEKDFWVREAEDNPIHGKEIAPYKAGMPKNLDLYESGDDDEDDSSSTESGWENETDEDDSGCGEVYIPGPSHWKEIKAEFQESLPFGGEEITEITDDVPMSDSPMTDGRMGGSTMSVSTISYGSSDRSSDGSSDGSSDVTMFERQSEYVVEEIDHYNGEESQGDSDDECGEQSVTTERGTVQKRAVQQRGVQERGVQERGVQERGGQPKSFHFNVFDDIFGGTESHLPMKSEVMDGIWDGDSRESQPEYVVATGNDDDDDDEDGDVHMSGLNNYKFEDIGIVDMSANMFGDCTVWFG